MIAVDTNILVYSHRQEMSFHGAALASVRRLANGREPWAIPWPCLHEMLAIVTHPRIFDPPTPLELACDQVEAWLESPNLVVLVEPEGLYWPELRACLAEGEIRGPQVHDARIAALCCVHGVTELWSADRHFGRFPRLKVVNPLTAA